MSVLIDEDNVIKIKEPEIIIANMWTIGFARVRRWNRIEFEETKMGFKQIYGYRLWIFYLTKMDFARNYSTAVPIM
jgi:hypothetical protein